VTVATVDKKDVVVRNCGDTILNFKCCHSPLEGATETRKMNVGNTQYQTLEELCAPHGQENKYGVPRISESRVFVGWAYDRTLKDRAIICSCIL